MIKTDPIYIIAEAGVNHNGSLKMAKELVDVAADAGADAVKFQTFKADECVSRWAKKAEYQSREDSQDESQLSMVKKLELNAEEHHELVLHCKQRDIQFLSTPFDIESVSLLANDLDLPVLKISSGEITNAPLLLAISSTGKPVIMSTGMATLAEIEGALGVLAFGYCSFEERPNNKAFRNAFLSREGQLELRNKVRLLHCTTEYPAPYCDVNLAAMDALCGSFKLPVGFSDHTSGIAIAIAAAARGAVIIEKHFTLDCSLSGPDHQASLEPDELKKMVSSIRVVEIAIGDGLKLPVKSELKNIDVARKSLVARLPIEKGEMFTETNIAIKRPGDGISPMRYWEYVGEYARKSYLEDEQIIP